MTDNINFTSFKAFVMAQDEGREIDHNSWETCAIGDYLNATDPNYIYNNVYITNSLALSICNSNRKLNNILSETNKEEMPTYKELQLLLAGYGGGV